MRHPKITPDIISSRQPAPLAAPPEVRRIVERSLQEVLLLCQQARAARQAAAEGSAEWHKRTGEILACAKLTKLLSQLQVSTSETTIH